MSALAVEEVDRQVVWERDEGICGKPADRDDWHLDHVIPLAAGVEAGGVHSYDNVQVAHPRCNKVKHSKMPEEAEGLSLSTET